MQETATVCDRLLAQCAVHDRSTPPARVSFRKSSLSSAPPSMYSVTRLREAGSMCPLPSRFNALLHASNAATMGMRDASLPTPMAATLSCRHRTGCRCSSQCLGGSASSASTSERFDFSLSETIQRNVFHDDLSPALALLKEVRPPYALKRTETRRSPECNKQTHTHAPKCTHATNTCTPVSCMRETPSIRSARVRLIACVMERRLGPSAERHLPAAESPSS